ncbi:hypothetical protein [Pseudomonas sp. N040]|uniref:hypothetical protein n=1 Tax=Pseudomonas sp. N040 TaxID=2785325 RepID=UPI0018A27E76|nr:hypothetical protein [Pseudomonas sp. N040]MBF7728630.1 hypothetical protein [Pseudomonas sp. N040]MBW7012270.1 hypothetical protein [Pseudomonas sp. N040]
MELVRVEQREFHAMRAHVAQLLAKGWVITSRNPLTLVRLGQTVVIRHGMLIGGHYNQ